VGQRYAKKEGKEKLMKEVGKREEAKKGSRINEGE
jgi:hypothetical protein